MAETIALPAFIDIHVHFREPGNNNAETIENGSRAALLGGYALIADMPNNPGLPTWFIDRLHSKHHIAEREAWTPVAFYAGSQPESNNLNHLSSMSEKAIGLKLYGAPTTGNHNEYVAEDFENIVATWHNVTAKPIMLHAGKRNLTEMIDLVAGKYDHRLHICHINDPDDVEVVSKAKAQGLPVSSGVTPHHLFKTSHDELSEGWFARMQPPLARQEKSEALLQMLAQGEIDLIESDYAPHTEEAKLLAEKENPQAIHDEHHTTCFGVPGIEHIVPMMLHQLQTGTITEDRLVDAMSTKPAELLGVRIGDSGTIWELTERPIKEQDIKSGAGWSPYIGKLAGGILLSSVIQGMPVYENGKAFKHKFNPVSGQGAEI
jgi:dihydroorotase